MTAPRFSSFILPISLALSSLVLALGIAEWSLRYIERTRYIPLWEPHFEVEFAPTEQNMPGVDGTKRFTTNSLGIRGDELPSDQTHRVLAIGGSTTECLYLDDQEAWPYLTQTMLRERGYAVWVGNLGKSGARIGSHLYNFDHILKHIDSIDTVVVLVGINELSASLRFTLEPNPRKSDGTPRQTPFYRNTALWRLASKVKQRLLAPQKKSLIQDTDGAIYQKWRDNRKAAQKSDAVPDLTQELLEYRTQLEHFVDLATKSSVRVVFMTQPSLWRWDLTLRERDLLWFGWGGNDQESSTHYYRMEVLKGSLDEFNRVLMEVCADRQVECIDLAVQLEKDLTVFYDDVHFNVSGSRKVAQILSDHFRSRGFLADETQEERR